MSSARERHHPSFDVHDMFDAVDPSPAARARQEDVDLATPGALSHQRHLSRRPRGRPSRGGIMKVHLALVAVILSSGCALDVSEPGEAPVDVVSADLATSLDGAGYTPVDVALNPLLTELAEHPSQCSDGAAAISEAVAPAEQLLACYDGANTCYQGRCYACCYGYWHNMNSCLYGVHFYCRGYHYNAYNCWPFSAHDNEEEDI